MEFYPVCLHCDRKRDGGMSCDAFPEGIPQDIARGSAFHLEPRNGDRGLTFEPSSDPESRRLYQLEVADGKFPPRLPA